MFWLLQSQIRSPEPETQIRRLKSNTPKLQPLNPSTMVAGSDSITYSILCRVFRMEGVLGLPSHSSLHFARWEEEKEDEEARKKIISTRSFLLISLLISSIPISADFSIVDSHSTFNGGR